MLAKNVEVDQNNWCCEDARRMDPSNKNRYYSYLYVLLKPLISLIYCSGQHKVDFQRNFQSYTIIFCGLACTPFNYARWLTSLFPRSEFMASDATATGQEVSLGAQRGLVRTLFFFKLPLFLKLLKNVHTFNFGVLPKRYLTVTLWPPDYHQNVSWGAKKISNQLV